MNIDVFIDRRGEPERVGFVRTVARSATVCFEYDPAWVQTGFAIDPQGLPLGLGPSYNPTLFGVIADCGPDRWGRQLIERAMRKGVIDRRSFHELDYVLALEDRTRIGALRFQGAGSEFLAATHGVLPPLLHLNQLLQAAQAVQANRESAQDLKYLLGYGSPLGGARPKSAILLPDGRFAIAKFPKESDTRNIAAGEVLCLELARRCGIRTAEAKYLLVDGHPISLITRFDRDERQHRLPFLSASTLLNRPSGDGGSYEAIGEVIRRFGAPDDLKEIWKRCLFSLLTSNYDDHLRNHGFLMTSPDKWQLSPAYDLNPTPEIERPHSPKTPILEEISESSIEVVLMAAERFGIEHKEAGSLIKQFADICSKWKAVGRELRLSMSDINDYDSAFENPLLEEAKRVSTQI